MTLRHFEIFRAVSETGSFTGAARELFITQSAVSHAIREMETETGAVLFDRISRRVYLTRSGELLMQKILPILSACENLQVHVRNLEKEAPIRIAASITIASWRLPDALLRFRKSWPDTPVETEVLSAANAMELLKNGGADIALIEGAPARLEVYIYERFSSYPMEFLVGMDYDLPERITIEQLMEQPLLLREKGSAIRDTLDSALFLAGYTARPVWTSVNSNALMEATAKGLGIALLPGMLVQEMKKSGRLKTVSVAGLALNNDMLLVHHREKYVSAPLNALMQQIRLCEPL